MTIGLLTMYGGCNPCGNGKLDKGEQCDDGNNSSFDGCSSDCKLETGETCVATTEAEFRQKAGNDSGFAPLLARAAAVGFKPTSPWLTPHKCSEGSGPVDYFAYIQPVNSHDDPLLIHYRSDLQQAYVGHVQINYSTSATDDYVEDIEMRMHLDSHVPGCGSATCANFDITDNQGNVLIPPTLMIQSSAATARAETAPPPADSTVVMGNGGGTINVAPELIPALDGSGLEVAPADLTSNATSSAADAQCYNLFKQLQACQARAREQVGPGTILGLYGSALACRKAKASCPGLGYLMYKVYSELPACSKLSGPWACVADGGPPDHLCFKGHCSLNIPDFTMSTCIPDANQGTTPTCDPNCDESCINGQCIGFKITATQPADLHVPDGGPCTGPPFNPSIRKGFAINYCGHPRWPVLITLNNLTCPFGWSCGSGAQYAPIIGENPINVPGDLYLGCCANGLPLPQNFQERLFLTDNGAVLGNDIFISAPYDNFIFTCDPS
jgi:cysteine-rich repeat protein